MNLQLPRLSRLTALPLLLALVLPTAAQEPGADSHTKGMNVALELQKTFTQIADGVAPSIVTVAAYERVPEAEVEEELSPKARWIKELDREYPGFRLIGSGSGVIVSEQGEVLTNRHFLLKPDGQPADLIDIETVDNRHTISRLVGMEPTLNMALLRLEVFSPGRPPEFKPIVFANSGLVMPGHWVLAVGDPFGPEKFFTTGLLAGTPSRECYQEQLTATYLQASLQLHPGAYGGPLVDLHGHFVGMLSPRNTELGPVGAGRPYGVEFALPSNIIKGLYKTILRNETQRSPWLGFAVMSIAELRKELGGDAFAELDRPRVGIYIENVFDPSPAWAAGIRPGDWMVKFDEYLIGSPLDFQKQLYLAGIGNRITLEMYRAGETITHEIEVELRPEVAITR